jgi:hypothetical protein
MEKGDVLLFSVSGTGLFNYKAEVLATLESAKLASRLWKSEGSEQWSMIFFLQSVVPVHLKKSLLVAALGYSEADPVMGMRRVTSDRLMGFLAQYGSLDRFLASAR